VTAPPDVAPRLAEFLIELKLAACVSLTPIHSYYEWNGKVNSDDEGILCPLSLWFHLLGNHKQSFNQFNS
jgi:uncharacterized protein involved in tolerance to divalent cations